MNITRIAIATVAFLVSTTASNAEWTSLQTHSDLLFGVDFESADQGWVSGALDGIGPVIKASDDGGMSWDYQTQAMNNMWWLDVDMADARYGFACGLVALIGRWSVASTTNGGQTWESSLSQFVIAAFMEIDAYDRNHAWAAGDWVAFPFREQRGVAYTTDGGANWIAEDWGLAESARFVDFVDAKHGFATGGHWPAEESDAGVIWRPTELHPAARVMPEEWGNRGTAAADDYGCLVASTDDGGATWNQVYSSDQYYPNHIDFTSRTEGWMVVEGGFPRVTQILHTTDAGATWNRQPHPLEGDNFSSITTINMLNRREGWVLGWGGTNFGNPETRMLHTMDGGENWEVDPFTSNIGPLHATFVDEGSGWTTGANNFNVSRVLNYDNPSRKPVANLDMVDAPETARPGETIRYTVAVQNLQNQALATDGWVQITGPRIPGYEANVVVRSNLRIPRGFSAIRDVAVQLPDLPAGVYAVESILGMAESERPSDIAAYTQFSLVVN